MYLALGNSSMIISNSNYDNIFGCIRCTNQSIAEQFSSTTPKSYFLNLSNLYSWYSEIGIPRHNNEEESWGLRIKNINIVIEEYDEEEELDLGDLQDKESSDDDEELDLDELKID